MKTKHISPVHPGNTNLNRHGTALRILPFLLMLLFGGLPSALQACNQAPPSNSPPTVCVTLLSNCTAQVILKGFTTYTNGPSAQFCSCAFKVVPSILSVDKVEIRRCATNDLSPCAASGLLQSNFASNGITQFVSNNLSSAFFAAASGSGVWQGFYAGVFGLIPQNQCVDMVFYVTLQSPCSPTVLAAELAGAGSIVGTSAAQSNGQPNGGHLGISVAGTIATGNPVLTIVQSGTQVIISWPNGPVGPGTLQEAVNITGPWTPITTSSPYPTPSTGPAKYYRLVF